LSVQDRRRREKERRHIEILDAAEKMFLSKGYENTTIDDIAEALEISKPVIYRSFENKERLFLAVASKGAHILYEMMEKKVALEKSGLDKVMATGTVFYQFFTEHPDYCRLMHSARHMLRLNVAKAEGEGKNADMCLEIICDAIENGKRDGSIRRDVDTRMTALFLMDASQSMLEMIDSIDGGFLIGSTREDYIKHSFDLMRHSLKK